MMINKKPTVLIVDDDFDIGNLLSKFLSQHDFHTLIARNGKEMFPYLQAEEINLIILDLMLPGVSGFDLCREIRKNRSLPIIILTAISEETDKIVGLELGADDYIVKPFNPRELLARIKAILRRTHEHPDNTATADGNLIIFHFSRWNLSKATRKLTSVDNMEVNLSSGEYELLLAFVTHPLRILNREQLLDLAKNRAAIPFDRSIDVQISRLRQKIEIDHKQPELIKTIRGGGYMFTAPVAVVKKLGAVEA